MKILHGIRIYLRQAYILTPRSASCLSFTLSLRMLGISLPFVISNKCYRMTILYIKLRHLAAIHLRFAQKIRLECLLKERIAFILFICKD